MKMSDAKREIEEKLFVGVPLSLDAMICAMAAINEYIDNHGSESSVSLDIKVEEEVNQAATRKLNDELQKGLDSGERDGWLSMEDVKKHLGLDEEF